MENECVPMDIDYTYMTARALEQIRCESRDRIEKAQEERAQFILQRPKIPDPSIQFVSHEYKALGSNLRFDSYD